MITGSPNPTVRIENNKYFFRTQKNSGKVGLMMVGLGGNNGTTILGGIIANREGLEWNTKKGIQKSNMYGSMTQSSTIKVADSLEGEIYLKVNQVLPMIRP
jgi:myo-inositol-1-phosphate synthase